MFGRGFSQSPVLFSTGSLYICCLRFHLENTSLLERSTLDGAVHECCTYLRGICVFLKRVCVISHSVGGNTFHSLAVYQKVLL